jgi:ribosomal protein S18 acetylase RimI-like enzyme
MPIALRCAVESDLPVLLDLLAVLDADGQPPLTLDQARRVFARIASYPDYAIWLAEEDGQPVATYSLLIMDNLGHRGAPEGVIENVAVAARCQGRGIGRAMMQHAMDQARTRCCYKLVLSSNVARGDAHRFYERLGFTRHGYSFRVEL